MCVAVSDHVSCLILSLGPVERLVFLRIELGFMNKAITRFVYNTWFISRQATFNCRLPFLDLWPLPSNCITLLYELCDNLRSEGMRGSRVLLCGLAPHPIFISSLYFLFACILIRFRRILSTINYVDLDFWCVKWKCSIYNFSSYV